MFYELNFPSRYDIRVKSSKDRFFIYDIVRKSWLVFTPEEWVRQHWVFFLVETLGRSLSSLVLERRISLHGMVRRVDLLLLEGGVSKVLFEFKSPEVPITEAVFDQVARYNVVVCAEYVVISNGIRHVFAYFCDGRYSFLSSDVFFDMLNKNIK